MIKFNKLYSIIISSTSSSTDFLITHGNISKTGNRVFQYCVSLDRLVPPTRTATTAGAGFPTQSQRRWWQLRDWRYYVRPDKTENPPQNSRRRVALTPNSSRELCQEGKGGNQRRTEEDAPQPERTVLCLLDTCMPAKTSAIQT